MPPRRRRRDAAATPPRRCRRDATATPPRRCRRDAAATPRRRRTRRRRRRYLEELDGADSSPARRPSLSARHRPRGGDIAVRYARLDDFVGRRVRRAVRRRDVAEGRRPARRQPDARRRRDRRQRLGRGRSARDPVQRDARGGQSLGKPHERRREVVHRLRRPRARLRVREAARRRRSRGGHLAGALAHAAGRLVLAVPRRIRHHGDDQRRRRAPRDVSLARADAAKPTEHESRRRRGCYVDIPWRRAAATPRL